MSQTLIWIKQQSSVFVMHYNVFTQYGERGAQEGMGTHQMSQEL